MDESRGGRRLAGKSLLQAREQAGLTQEELAHHSDVSVRTIRALEAGRPSRPYVATFKRLAIGLGLPDSAGTVARRQYLNDQPVDALAPTAVAADHADAAEQQVHAPPMLRDAATPRQLPAPPGMFVGRRSHLAMLSTALRPPDSLDSTMRIAAVAGTGGIGKTWLALHWAYQNLDAYPDGQLFVDLRGFDPSHDPVPPEAAVRGFLDALGVNSTMIPANPDAQVGLYRSLIADRRMLLLLDNARDADQVIRLLPGTPSCTVIVTSRDSLAGLVTAHSAHPVPIDILNEQEAHQLLTRRLNSKRVSDEPEAVGELLIYCAGLPLALGILAGRAVTHPRLPLRVLAAELRDAATRLDAFDEGDAAASLRAVLSQSHNALPEQHALVFSLLALAPGPDISTIAVSNLIALPVSKTRIILRALERASLLEQHVSGRYRMHDLIRLYASHQAHEDQPQGIVASALSRLVEFYVHTARAGDKSLHPDRTEIKISGPAPGCLPGAFEDVAAAMAWFDAEHPCLLAIHQLAVEQGWHEAVWQLAWTLDTFRLRRGHLHDNLTAWRAGLAATKHLDDVSAQAIAHRLLGVACSRLDHHDEAIDNFQSALTFARDNGDLATEAHTLTAMARVRARQRDNRSALEHATQSLSLHQVIDNPLWEAYAHNAVGWYAALLEHYSEARIHCEAALKMCRGHGYRQGEASALDSLGYIAHRSGQTQRAVTYYNNALELFRDLGNAYDEADTLDRLGHAHATLDQPDLARCAWQQALTIYQRQHRATDVDRIQRQLVSIGESAVK